MSLTRRRANLLIVVAAACWGFSNVPQKQVLEHIGPFMAVGLRCLIGALVLMPLLTAERKHPVGRDRLPPTLALAVVVLFALGMTAQQAAYGGTSIINGSFLVNTATVLTPVAAWLLHRTAPGLLVALAVLLSFTGASLMVGGSFTMIAWGDAMMLLAAATFALWYVVLGDAVVRSGRPAFLTLLQFAAAGVLCLALGLVIEQPSAAALWAALPNVLLLGIFGTGVSFALLSVAQRHTSPNEAAILCSAESVFGMIGGMVLGESLATGPAFGAALIIAAILLVQLGPALLAAPQGHSHEPVQRYEPGGAE